ncbi:MAG: isoprenyl transferase [Chloroflexi bacterium]|nr:isoprenyl transferase [Chloroflexota bacterium]
MKSKANDPLHDNAPQHVAIIMDGNGRWARERGLPRLAGHQAGTKNLRRIIEACIDFNIKYLTLYAFSTENWERPVEEVRGLMRILGNVIDSELDELHAEGVAIRHVGQLDRVKPALKKKMLDAVELTKNNDRLILNVAFNYGGRSEIVWAIRRMIEDGVQAEAITDDLVDNYLYTAGVPDPDLIIRTSGELRTSNFLIWQGAYSEWYFTPTYWPDFGKQALRSALEEYSQRSRRYGRVETSPTAE